MYEQYITVSPLKQFMPTNGCNCKNIFIRGSASCVVNTRTVTTPSNWFINDINLHGTVDVCKWSIGFFTLRKTCDAFNYGIKLTDTVRYYTKYHIEKNNTDIYPHRHYNISEHVRHELYNGVCGYSMYHCECGNLNDLSGVINANGVPVNVNTECSWMMLYRMLLGISLNDNNSVRDEYCIDISGISDDISKCLKFFNEHVEYVNNDGMEFTVRYSNSVFVSEHIHLITVTRRIRKLDYYVFLYTYFQFTDTEVEKRFMCISGNVVEKFMTRVKSITCQF